MWNIIFITGLVGSGKTTQAELLIKVLKEKFNVQHIDQNSFYMDRIPVAKLSNGKKVKNYDALDAIDIASLRKAMSKMLKSADNSKTNILVVSGSCLRDNIFRPVINDFIFNTGPLKLVHIHLKITPETAAKRDAKSKLIMKELTYPFYLKTMEHMTINLFVDGTLKESIIHNRIKFFVELFIRI